MSLKRTLSAKRLSDRAWAWRQMATQAERRDVTWTTVLRYPFLKWCYRRKKTWSHVAPVLVVGQNPWLNALAVWRLSFTNDEVWVWDVDGVDWWNYNIVHTPAFSNACKKWFPYLNFKGVREALSWVRAQACEQAQVRVLGGGFAPWQIFKDAHTNGWVFKLTEGTWPVMSGLLAAEPGREKSRELLASKWAGATSAEWPKTVESNRDDELPCHYLLAKRVVWSSLPPSGVSIATELNQDYRLFEFGAEAMGCAKRIAQTPEAFFQHPFDDTEAVLKL